MPTLYIIGLILISIILIRLLFRKVLSFPKYSGELLAKNVEVENIMDEEIFWLIINEARVESKNNYKLQCQLLTNYLSNLTEQEIIQFDRTFSFLIAKTYSFSLWEPVYSLNGGNSDDAFEYFRSWLIGQGKDKFYWTIKYPRLLFLIGVKELMERYEGLALCSSYAYTNKTGHSLPQHTDIKYSDGGQMFSEGKAFLKYPELALLAW